MRPRIAGLFVRIEIIFVLLSSVLATGQTRPLTVEWIWKEGAKVARVPSAVWLYDGTLLSYDDRAPEAQRTFERLDPATGQRQPVLDMSKAVASLRSLAPVPAVKQALPWPIAFDSRGQRAVYVFDGDVFLLDVPAATFTRVTDTKEAEKDPEFSPDGRLLAFIRANYLYVYDIEAQQKKRLTSDGSPTLLNGTLSWVYWEEIFGRRDRAYWWSPDSRAIAYLQTDESQVPVSTFVDFAPVNTRVIRQPYPKAGEHNPEVRVGVVEVENGSTRWVSITDKPFEWILEVKWPPDANHVAIKTLNRAQTELGLYFADRKTGAAKRILTDTDPAWVNVSEDLYFLKDGRHFLFASERDGYMHLYRYRMDGTLENQVTKGRLGHDLLRRNHVLGVAGGGGNRREERLDLLHCFERFISSAEPLSHQEQRHRTDAVIQRTRHAPHPYVARCAILPRHVLQYSHPAGAAAARL